MNQRSIQTIVILFVAVGLIYSLVILQRDGILADMWATLQNGGFYGLPL